MRISYSELVYFRRTGYETQVSNGLCLLKHFMQLYACNLFRVPCRQRKTTTRLAITRSIAMSRSTLLRLFEGTACALSHRTPTVCMWKQGKLWFQTIKMTSRRNTLLPPYKIQCQRRLVLLDRANVTLSKWPRNPLNPLRTSFVSSETARHCSALIRCAAYSRPNWHPDLIASKRPNCVTYVSELVILFFIDFWDMVQSKTDFNSFFHLDL